MDQSLYEHLKPAQLMTAVIVLAGLIAFGLLMGVVVGPSAAEMQAGPFQEQQMEFAIERQRIAADTRWELQSMPAPAGR